MKTKNTKTLKQKYKNTKTKKLIRFAMGEQVNMKLINAKIRK